MEVMRRWLAHAGGLSAADAVAAVGVAAGTFVAGYRLASGVASPLAAAVLLAAPPAAALVWQRRDAHPPARQRLDVLIVGLCAAVWLLALVL